jgi:1,4-alpha-glucan branching enzyme
LDSFPGAHRVIITGSFNNWSTNDYRMVGRDGKWVFPIWLKPGKHTYKFIIDGTWILDPKNEHWEENEYGTHNSVLWVEP